MRFIVALRLAHSLSILPAIGSIPLDCYSDGTIALSVDAGATGMSVNPITGLEFASLKVIVDFTMASGTHRRASS